MAVKKEELPADLGLADDTVVTKYKLAAEMANRVLGAVVAAAVAGASTVALCKLGDDLIVKETAAVYNKKVDGKATDKGVGFPTCISVNEIVCHNSPLATDAEELIKDGDVVKIDLGVHLDGYVAPVAATVVVGASAAAPATGKRADVVLAAFHAAEVALRLCKPGNKSDAITAAINKVAKDFGCHAVEGMLMHRVKQNVIADQDKAIIQNPSEGQKKDHKECTFEVNEAYAIDVIISSGEGKARASERKTTVYRKTETVYQLRMKTSRQVHAEIAKKFTSMPFTVRSCEDEKRTLLGLNECAQHNVVEPFSILTERDGEFVAQFKALILLLPNGNVKATFANFDADLYKSEHSVTDEALKALLAESLGSKNKKKKKAAKKDGEGAAAAAAADPEAGDA